MATGDDVTIGALGEFGLIDAVTARLTSGAGVLLGPGDDAAVVAAPDGRVVVSTDLLVQDRHFRLDWSRGSDVGCRAAAANLADIAAMGAVPTALVVGLAAPADLAAGWVLDLVDGMREECAAVGASVVGGDVVGADRVHVAVTVLGDLQGRAPVLRSGARAGDTVAVCGRLGFAAAGLAALTAGRGDAHTELVAAHRRPRPPYRAGPQAAAAGAGALIDISDGLLADLGHLARASGVRLDLDPDALAPDPALPPVAADLGVPSALPWVLTGGDDHALAACFPRGVALPPQWRAVGTAIARGDDPPAVTVGGRDWDAAPGWDHFA